MPKKKPTFEQALCQLEEIAEQIEQGKIGLEESINQYEQGMALVKQCRDMLSAAEQKVQKLQESADGSIEIHEQRSPAADEKEVAEGED